MKKIHFLNTIQPIYLRKSNGLICMKQTIRYMLSISQMEKKEKSLQNMFNGNEKVDKFLSRLTFYCKGGMQGVSVRNIHKCFVS